MAKALTPSAKVVFAVWPRSSRARAESATTCRADWLRRADVVPWTPFLLSPLYEYDVVLNEFFQSVEIHVRRDGRRVAGLGGPWPSHGWRV